ncbi:uncharacterized protein C20orf196 homolog isoform X2 [Heterocephalus glaber]|nr:uncharacterized protein C20orf196 homolog isoform X2 [Heterocephalus glaber]XP_021110698.1 uncharacterized protein C20orf196 homolog isoform X2 [Heterocephalus glaber]
MAAAGSPPGDSLDLPSASAVGDYVLLLRRPGEGAGGESLSSAESHSVPCSSDIEPDSGNLNAEQKDSWICENLWPDSSAKSQLEAKKEDNGLRESLDRFYEVFSHPQPASGDPLLASVCQCLSQKIAELRGQGSQKYTLRSFQMARVIFNRDGCSVLRKHCRDTRFYPLREGSTALDEEKQTPGLSKAIIRFLLQQNVMKDP